MTQYWILHAISITKEEERIFHILNSENRAIDKFYTLFEIFPLGFFSFLSFLRHFSTADFKFSRKIVRARAWCSRQCTKLLCQRSRVRFQAKPKNSSSSSRKAMANHREYLCQVHFFKQNRCLKSTLNCRCLCTISVRITNKWEKSPRLDTSNRKRWRHMTVLSKSFGLIISWYLLCFICCLSNSHLTFTSR